MTLITVLLAVSILAVIFAPPLTWVAMLFLGNIGINLGFWEILPAAIAVTIIKTNYNTSKP